MAENRDKRDDRDDDDEMQDLKPRRRREVVEEEELDDKPRRKRRAEPAMKSFTVMYNFGKYYATCEYEAPEGYTADDVDDFIYAQKQDGAKVFEPRPKDRDRERGGNGGYNRGGNDRYNRGGDRYESRRRYND